MSYRDRVRAHGGPGRDALRSMLVYGARVSLGAILGKLRLATAALVIALHHWRLEVAEIGRQASEGEQRALLEAADGQVAFPLTVSVLQQLDYAPLPSGSDPLLLRWFGEQVSLWKGRKAEEVDMAKVIDPKRLLATRMAARMRHLHSEMSVRLPEPLSPHASASTPPSPTLPPALRDGQGADGDGSAAAAAEGDEASGVLTAARVPPRRRTT